MAPETADSGFNQWS